MIPDKNISAESPYKLCFVCLGNICRSPTAEGIFRHLVAEKGLDSYFEIDSAGTSAYHEGEAANSKSRQTARSHGISLDSRARRFEYSDLEYFDLILAMDRENHSDILQLDSAGHHEGKVLLMREFDPDPGDKEVPDPYFGGMDGFERVFDVVHRSCVNLLDQLEERIDGTS